MKLSIVIPTLNAAETLPNVFARIRADHEIIVVDGGSKDDTVNIAKEHGARVVQSEPGRGLQLATGAAVASGEWLLFLHADTCLQDGWFDAVQTYCAAQDSLNGVAVFQFALDADTPQARRLERAVAWRTRWLGLPYGDQGLLISRKKYILLGGFQPIPLMEDVALIRRVSCRQVTQLPVQAVTSARRWQQDGWWCRSLKNLCCLSLYFLGLSPHRIARIYR